MAVKNVFMRMSIIVGCDVLCCLLYFVGWAERQARKFKLR